MKKNLVLAVALFTLMAVGVSAQTGTAGLAFTAIDNNKAYSVSKGTVTSGAVVIPAAYNNLPVTTIAVNAFSGLKGITGVTIPNSITSIEAMAFLGCAGITNLTIPKSVINIGNAAFQDCTGLTSVTFEGTINVNSVDQRAFANLGDMGSNRDLRIAFYTGAQLAGWAATYTRPNSTSAWTRQAQAAAASAADPESDFQVTKTGNAITITRYVGNKAVVNIPSTIQSLPVTSIGNNAFYLKEITGVTIPNSVTSIGETAFSESKLTSVTIPSSVTSIGVGAFGGCKSLNSVTFQGTIPIANFSESFTFNGDLRDKFYATDKAKGTAGTYTTSDRKTWTKK